MISIKDFDEKKMIIGYLKCVSKKENVCYPFNNNWVYHRWLSLWADDFRVDIDGKCLIIYDNKFILSKGKHKKGIKPPKYYDEYTELLSTATQWINDNYNKDKDGGYNAESFAELIIEHRKKCGNELRQNLKELGLDAEGYIIRGDSFKAPTRLCIYHLNRKDTDGKISTIKYGTYTEIKAYISELSKNQA